MFEGLLAFIRPRLPSDVYVFNPFVLRKRQLSMTLPQRRAGQKQRNAPLPTTSVFPFISISKRWALYVARRTSPSAAHFSVSVHADASAPAEAFQATTLYFHNCFSAAFFSQHPICTTEWHDFAVLCALARVLDSQRAPLAPSELTADMRSLESMCRRLLTINVPCPEPSLVELCATDPELGNACQTLLVNLFPQVTRRQASRTLASSTSTSSMPQPRPPLTPTIQTPHPTSRQHDGSQLHPAHRPLANALPNTPSSPPPPPVGHIRPIPY